MILKELKINTFVGDPTNCYIIYDEESKETMCIDPAGDVEKIEYMIHIKRRFKIHLSNTLPRRSHRRSNRIKAKMWRKNINTKRR